MSGTGWELRPAGWLLLFILGVLLVALQFNGCRKYHRKTSKILNT